MVLKDAVLEMLEQNREQSLSGQKIAGNLSVTRAAVWKAVEELRQEGYVIDAVTNRGYQLSRESDLLSEAGLRTYLRPGLEKLPVYIYKSIDSTSSEARRIMLNTGNKGPFLVMSEEQTNGHGQPGRRFYSPAQTGLYMSLVATPRTDLSNTQLAIISAAVAVCKAIEDLTDKRPGVKWPNDIILGERKIGGVLTEGEFVSTVVQSLLVGIGLNIKTPHSEFPEVLRNKAGSLFPGNISRNQIAATIVNYLNVMETGEYPDFLEDYKKRSLTLGQEVSYVRRGVRHVGRAVDIDYQGRLVLEDL